MGMNRRHFMKSAALMGAAGTMLDVKPVRARGKYNLRYAPRLDFLSREWSIEQRLEYFSAKGFDGTEYNSLMRRMTLKEAESYRKQLDTHGIEQGILVVNRGGLGAELYSKEGQQSFLEDVEKAKQYHRILDNKSATVVTGPELEKIPRDKQVRNIIDLYKRAVLIASHTPP